MILGLYKKHFKQINIKNKVYNYYNNLIKQKSWNQKYFNRWKNLWDKNLTICFSRYNHKKLTRMFNFYYHELMGKIEEYEGKKIFDSWWLYAR